MHLPLAYIINDAKSLISGTAFISINVNIWMLIFCNQAMRVSFTSCLMGTKMEKNRTRHAPGWSWSIDYQPPIKPHFVKGLWAYCSAVTIPTIPSK